MTDHIPSNPCNYRDLVSDLVACALIEGNRHTQAAEFETKKAKQKVIDLFEAMESVGIWQERALASLKANACRHPLEHRVQGRGQLINATLCNVCGDYIV